MKKHIFCLVTLFSILLAGHSLHGMKIWNWLRGNKASNILNVNIDASGGESELVGSEPAGKIVYKKTLSQLSKAEYKDGCAFFALFRALNLNNDLRAVDKKAFNVWLKNFHKEIILDRFNCPREEWIEKYKNCLFKKAFANGKAKVSDKWCHDQATKKYDRVKSKALQNLHSGNFRSILERSICSNDNHGSCSKVNHIIPGQIIIWDSLTELLSATNNWLCQTNMLRSELVQNLRLFQQGETVAIILNTGQIKDSESGGAQIAGTHWITLILKKVNGQATLCIYDSMNPDSQRALKDNDPRSSSFKKIYDFWTNQDPEKYFEYSKIFSQFQKVFVDHCKARLYSSIYSISCQDNRSLVLQNLAEDQGILIEKFAIDFLLPAILTKIMASNLSYVLNSGKKKKKLMITFENSFLQGKPVLEKMQKDGLKQGRIEVRLKTLKQNKATKQFSNRIGYVLETLNLLINIKEIQGYFKNPAHAHFFLSIIEKIPKMAIGVRGVLDSFAIDLAQQFTGMQHNSENYKKFISLIAIFNVDVCPEDYKLSTESIELLGLKILQSLRVNSTNS